MKIKFESHKFRHENSSSNFRLAQSERVENIVRVLNREAVIENIFFNKSTGKGRLRFVIQDLHSKSHKKMNDPDIVCVCNFAKKLADLYDCAQFFVHCPSS